MKRLECSVFFVDGFEVIDSRVATIRKEQAALQRCCGWEKLPLGFRIGRNLNGSDFVRKTAVRRMYLNRRRFDRREPTREHIAQRLLERRSRT